MFTSTWGDLNVKDEVWKKITTSLLSGDCQSLKEVLMKVSDVANAINSVFTVRKPVILNVRLDSKDEAKKLLRHGVRCLDDSLLIMDIDVNASEVDEEWIGDDDFISDDVCESDNYDTQSVEVTSYADAKKVLDMVEDGEVPLYNEVVDVDTFINKGNISKEFKGEKYTVSPDILYVDGVGDIRVSIHAKGVLTVGDAVLKVSTYTIWGGNHVDRKGLRTWFKEFRRIKREYGVKGKSYVNIEVERC